MLLFLGNSLLVYYADVLSETTRVSLEIPKPKFRRILGGFLGYILLNKVMLNSNIRYSF